MKWHDFPALILSREYIHPHWTGQPKKFVQERWIGERDEGVLESVKTKFQHFVGIVYFQPFLPTTKALVLRVL